MKKSILYQYLFIVVIVSNYHILGAQKRENLPEPWITVFVHGIIGLDAKVCFANAFQFLTDHIANTVYAKSVEYMREDPFFTKNQAMQNLGLQPIDLDNYTKGYASAALARTYNYVLSLCPIKQKTYYYTFGWSGLLSFKARYHDAQLFYQSLVNLQEKMNKQNIHPKIRLIGYSHGANICLNLAKVQQEEPYDSMPLEIDELILLGAPIQRETENLVEYPIFKKVYSFYSRSDNVQKKDLFSSQQLFSKRVFRNRREFTLPPSLTQVEIKILIEKKKTTKKFTKTTEISQAADVRKKSVVKGHFLNLKNMSPGHSELWFMAWTPRNYRRDFPLYPIPIVTISPYIIQLIEATRQPQTKSRHILVDIRPDHHYMVIRQRYPKPKKSTVISFLSQDNMNVLNNISMPNKPDNYTPKDHDAHRNLAHQKALEYRKEHRRLRRIMRGKRTS